MKARQSLKDHTWARLEITRDAVLAHIGAVLGLKALAGKAVR